MPEPAEIFDAAQRPTAERPLLGQTLLVVEDSRFACEALRLMCIASGARIRRADSLRAAARHLAVYRPSVLVIDIGLPDGSGLDLIRALSRTEPRVPVILAMSGDEALRGDALSAGADDFLSKPLPSVATFQSAIIAHLPPEARPPGLRLADKSPPRSPDALAFRDDLARIASLLEKSPDLPTRRYASGFLYGVARSAGDDELAVAASSIVRDAGALDHLRGLLDSRLSRSAVV
jgi:CheY-like chemotaxis protein